LCKGVVRAQAALEQAQLSFRRTEALARTNAATPADLDAARATLRQTEAILNSLTATRMQTQGRLAAASAAVNDARAAVRASEAALQYAQAQLAQTEVLSPFDGLVVSRNLEEGEWAAPGTPIVTLEDNSRPWIRLDVPETLFANVQLGQGAHVHVIALGPRTFRGHVALIGAEGDFAIDRDVKRGRPDIRTFLVRVALDEVPPLLRPGMTAEVHLDTDVRAPSHPHEVGPPR
jgi:RND family efflux transporter MFP subunit